MILSASILDRLSSQHKSITEIISGADETRIAFHPAPGKWSAHDNIAHLARYNIVFQERLQKIISEEEQTFPRYIAENDSEFPQWQEMKTNGLLSSVQNERMKIFSFANSIPGNHLKRIGIHPRFGRLNVADWLEFFLLHEAHHMFTIFQLVKVVK